MNFTKNKDELEKQGYSLVNGLYTEQEIKDIVNCLEASDASGSVRTKDVFAIRQLINHIPELKGLLLNKNLLKLIGTFSNTNYFLSKAIYFDKPSDSNWFVAYHQDLSITVDQKLELNGYSNWTYKKGQYGVQPPLHVLEDTITVRIHLDDTNEGNGALKVIPESHLKGVIQIDQKEWNMEDEYICAINKGGAMLMKPLTLHASNRTVNGKRRRVIHLEFNQHQLASPLQWVEFNTLNKA
ncbi:phytanoyl-CoA dioxygenase family protein [Flammeovirga sp. SJP92]|uniref:phytanoyl-CoA dioxygenase family protein n=1 Tax=Flammeovirga sp. SJP92 TaxID=1775430 RepID=UPI000787E822|nr:phytanoyl-CoA dioxygenase family protein [Flammeovirga sp. SJP92]KXX67075.1 phytanoyl-CoA dioxygenase [Flammeovirga sp. SJP92]